MKPGSGVAVELRGCLKSVGALQQCVSSADVLPGMSDDAARSCLPGVPRIGWRAVQSQSKVLRSGADCRFPSVKSQRGALVSVAKNHGFGWGFFRNLRAPGCLCARGISRRSPLSRELGVGGSVPAVCRSSRAGPACRERGWRGASCGGRASSLGSAPTTRPRTGA